MKELGKYFDLRLLIAAIISAFVHAEAFVNFTVPAKIYPGGFSGISRIISDVLAKFAGIDISFTVFYAFLNIVVSLLVFRYIGHKFTIYSVIQFLATSFFADRLHPFIDVSDPLLLAVFGGICNGLAIGIALENNISSAGFDFLSVYYSTKYKKSMWNVIFGINCFILLIAGILFGFEKSLYSIILQYCSTSIVKRMHKRFTHITITVVTAYPEEVAGSIIQHVRHGITEIEAQGFYSHSKTTMLYTVVNTYQKDIVISSILEADAHAFINIQNTEAVVGNYYQKPLD